MNGTFVKSESGYSCICAQANREFQMKTPSSHSKQSRSNKLKQVFFFLSIIISNDRRWIFLIETLMIPHDLISISFRYYRLLFTNSTRLTDSSSLRHNNLVARSIVASHQPPFHSPSLEKSSHHPLVLAIVSLLFRSQSDTSTNQKSSQQ